jgi:hypothetical protein
MNGKSNGFIMLEHEMMRTPAWQSLSPAAVCLLLDLWRRFNGRNNGEISYSIRRAQHYLGCSPKFAVKLIAELQSKGFIVVTRKGSFQVKTGAFVGRASTWRLTMLPCNGQEATHDYREWRPA